MSIRLTIFCIFAIVLGQCITANAQTVQPQYVRPSKGAAVQILNASAVNATTTYTASAIFDWTAFAGAVLTVNAPTADSPYTECRYGVRVKALGGTNTTRSDFFILNVPSASREVNTSQAWYLRVLPNYIYFQMESYDAGAGKDPTCGAYKITVTPLPFDYSGLMASGSSFGNYDTTPPESTAAFVTFTADHPNVRIQNVTNAARTNCIPYPNDTPSLALNLYPIQLKPESTLGAGDGGVVEINSWVGTLQCWGKFVVFAH